MGMIQQACGIGWDGNYSTGPWDRMGLICCMGYDGTGKKRPVRWEMIRSMLNTHWFAAWGRTCDSKDGTIRKIEMDDSTNWMGWFDAWEGLIRRTARDGLGRRRRIERNEEDTRLVIVTAPRGKQKKTVISPLFRAFNIG